MSFKENNKYKVKKIINASVGVGTITNIAFANSNVAVAADMDEGRQNSNNESTVTLNEDESVNEKGAFVAFKDKNTGKYVDAQYIKILSDDEKEIYELPINSEDNSIDLSGFHVGDSLSYEISIPGYKLSKGSFVIGNEDVEQEVMLEEDNGESPIIKEINKVYGDSPLSVQDIINDINDISKSIQTVVSDNEDAVKVNDGNIVEIVGAGKANLKINLDADENHAAREIDIPFNISKKRLTFKSDDFEWEKLSKVYDGSDALEIKGKLKEDNGIESGDKIPLIVVSAKLTDANVGVKSITSDSYDLTYDENNYDIEFDGTSMPQINITPFPVNLELKDQTIKYGSKEWESFKTGEIPLSLMDLKNYKYNIETPLILEEFEKLDLKDSLSLSVNPGSYYVGNYTDALKVRFVSNSARTVGNFKLNLVKNGANIVVEQAEDGDINPADMVEVDEGKSSGIYKSDNDIFVKSGSKLALNVIDKNLYDSAKLGLGSLDKFEDIVEVPDDLVEGEFNVSTYLYNKNSESTKTAPQNISKYNFFVDNTAPAVHFVDGIDGYGFINNKRSEFTNDDDLLNFTKINSKKGYTLSISANDDASGIASKEYAIINVKPSDDTKKLVMNSLDNPNISWKKLDDDKISVPGEREGYYLVLVKTVDNVGNISVHASNGTVIDTTSPVISVKGIDNEIYYKDINYSITIEDPRNNGVSTGIKTLSVKVYDNGKLISDKSGKTNSFTLSSKDLYGEDLSGDTFDNFNDFSIADREINVDSKIDINSNNIKIDISAIDSAGNIVTNKTIEGIRIDKGIPTLTGSFDDKVAYNENYFNESRELSIDINQKNFDEENLKFEFDINGKKDIYTIDDIKKGSVSGVSLLQDKKDNQEGFDPNDYTDDRKINYKLQFGNNSSLINNNYKINVYYLRDGKEHKLDFKDELLSNSQFVIDNVSPTISLKQMSEGVFLEPSETKKEPVYSNTNIKNSITIIDSHFDPKDVDVKVNSWDYNGVSVPGYKKSSLDKIKNNDNWIHDGDKHTFVFDEFDIEANYELNVSYVDLAGNKLENNLTSYFTVDKSAPSAAFNLSVLGKEFDYSELVDEIEKSNGIKKFIFNLFVNTGVDLVDKSSDNISGIKSVKYFVDDAPSNSSDSFDMNLKFDEFNWKDIDDFSTIDIDRNFVIYERVEDNAGNVRYISSKDGIILDTKLPNKPIIEILTDKIVDNKEIPISIKTSDTNDNGKFSGIKTITYEVYDKVNKKVTQKDTFTVPKSRSLDYNTSIKIDNKEENHSNELILRVYVTDYANNTNYAESNTFAFDNVSPVVSARMNKIWVRDEKFYNRSKTVEVLFKEKNFDSSSAMLSLDINDEKYKFSMKDIEDGKAEPFGISLKSKKDSEEKKNFTEFTDNRKISYSLIFGNGDKADFDYSNIVFSAIDAAGNVSNNANIDDFVIVKVAPKINIDFKTDNVSLGSLENTTKDNPYYTNKNLSPTITILDRHFNPENVRINITEVDVNGRALNNYKLDNKKLIDRWQESSFSNVLEMDDFIGNGRYTIDVSYENRAGNSSQDFQTRYFVVDKEEPSVKFDSVIKGERNTFSDILTSEDLNNGYKLIKFGGFDNNSITINDDSSDSISGIKSIKYYIKDLSKSELSTGKVSLDFSDMKFEEYVKPLQVSSDSAFVVYARVEDMSGNISYAVSKFISVVDTAKPLKPVITSSDVDYLSNKPINLNINSKDVENDGKYSGIKYIDYEVYNGDTNKATQKDRFYLDDSRNIDVNKQLILNANNENNSNNLIVKVKAFDYSGNFNESEKTYGIDITNPVVEGFFDNSDVKNGKYYNDSKTLNVKFIERNYEPSKSMLSVNINGEPHTFSMNEIKNGLTDKYGIKIVKVNDSYDGVDKLSLKDDRVVSYDLIFGDLDKADIDYENIKFYSEDLAGNKSNIYSFDDISVDKSIPSTEITFSENGTTVGELKKTSKSHPYYTNNSVSANISINDRRFDPNNVEINIEQYDFRGRKVDSYQLDYKALLNNWKSDGKINTLTLDSFDNDARYSISVKYKNLSGTDAPDSGVRYFVVDKTAPIGKFIINVNGKDLDYSSAISELEKQSNRKSFKFDIFAKNVVRLKDVSTDETAGIKSVKYYIDDTAVNAKENFEMVMNLDSNEFKDLNNEVEIKPDKNFVIYERIEDMSGNIAYISSNGGIAIDSKSPSKPIININGDNKKIYNEDIQLELDSRENAESLKSGVFSGLKNIKFEVYNSDKNEITQSGEFEIFESRIAKRLNSLIIDSNKNNSNNIRLKVVVSDYAGNENELIETYAVDKTAPKINVSFDNSDVKNEKYYNKTKFIDLDFVERNFDPKTSYLNLDINGRAYSFSMDDIANGKAKEFGISAENKFDSQKNRDFNSFTDDRINTYRISIGNTVDADFDYQNIKFTSVDEVGNTSNVATIDDVSIDKVAPKLDVLYFEDGVDITNKISTSKINPYYTNRDVVAVVNVKERNFKSSDIVSSLSQNKHDGQSIYAYSFLDELSNKEWNKNGDMYSFEMKPFSSDAIYRFNVAYEDLAGNKAELYQNRYFAIDKTPPQGGIDVLSDDNNARYDNLSSIASFDHVSKNSIILSVDGNDDTTGLKSIDYYIYDPGVEARNDFNVLNVEQLRGVSWAKYSSPINIKPDSHAVVYAKFTDMANNITYINTKGAVLADKTEPSEPVINIKSTTNASQGVFNHDVDYDIHVEDVLNGGTYAGLKNVTVEVLSDGVVTQSKTYNVGSKQARVKNFNTFLTVDSNKNNSNNVIVRVTATDNALNTKVEETKLAIDITPPRIEVVYDLNEPLNGKYYNKRRTATIKVYERNFDPSLVNLDIKGGNVQVGTWQIGGLNGVSDDNVNVLNIIFDDDADYSFTFGLSDGAGNSSKYDRIDEFTIDQTNPTINVAYDRDLVNGRYTNKTRTATITINEHNFNSNDVVLKINGTLDEKNINTPSISSWNSNGDKHTSTITFANDGDYNFTVDYKDLAGNKFETYKEDIFTVDKTPVKIEFERVLDKSTNKNEVKPLVKFTDFNFNKSTTSLTLTGLKHQAKTVKYNYQAIKNGGIFELFDLPHTEDVDDIYTLTAKSIDFAGNETISEITFAVNRYGSIFYLDDESRYYVDSYYNNKEEDIVVYEVNPDEVEDVSIVVNRDGTTKKLSKNEFKLVDQSEKNGWHKYKYIIPKEEFSKEGLYSVVVQSIDKAGNKQDNVFKKLPIEFVIDKTKPNAVITGIENNKAYNDTSREVGFVLSDNIGIGSAKVFVNDKKVIDFNHEDLKKNKGEFSYTLKESDDWQEIKVAVTDNSGNTFETKPMNVIVSSSLFVRLKNNIWFKYSPLGLIALFLMFLLFAKRDNDNDEEQKM